MNSPDPVVRRISKARSLLLLNNPWFGALAMRLDIRQFDDPTMATDGTHLFYNPKFVETLEDEELRAVIAHEILHCALRHMFRRGMRNHTLWNVSCDFAINLILDDCKFKLPKGALLDQKYKDMSSEQIYALLEQQINDGAQMPDHTKCGSFIDPPKGGQGEQDGEEEDKSEPQPEPMTETDWEIAVEQATAVAKKAGKLPGSIETLINDARQTETDWKALLRRFVQNLKPSHISWSRPNRRLLHQGIYLPGVVKENCPGFAIAIDTSGSITNEVLDIFAAEIRAIKHEMKPEGLQVIYCDSRINHVDEFGPEDDLTFKAVGRGGTAFTPVFEMIREQDEKPAAIIYLTDLYGDNSSVPDIGIPTLWVTSEKSNIPAPFGELVKISSWQN